MTLQEKLKNTSKYEILLQKIKNLERYDLDIYDDGYIDKNDNGEYLKRKDVIKLVEEFIDK